MASNFKRGSHSDEDAHDAGSPDAAWPGCGDNPLPPAGRDKTVMFWESIGMKPGDDWQVTAEDKPPGRGEP